MALTTIARAGADLVIESSDDSTIATKVTVTPADARRSIGVLLTSPSVWRFLVGLPFSRTSSRSGPDSTSAWAQRRRRTGLNKPW